MLVVIVVGVALALALTLEFFERTISNFDLDAAIALCDILDASYNFRHAGSSSTRTFCDGVSSARAAD